MESWTVWQIVRGVLAAFALLLLPGMALRNWLGSKTEDPAVWLADSVCLSIAVPAILGIPFFLFSIHLPVAWFWVAAAVLLLLVIRDRSGWTGASGTLWLAIAGAVGLVIAWRLFQVRDLVLPAWVDSVHHVLIVRQFLEQGGIPVTMQPYLPVPFYYHYGFHILTALFSAAADWPPERSTLVLGQILNALAALSVYRLACSLWNDYRIAAIAGLLVALVTQMPAYYASWGRYTLLTGMLLLPCAMAWAIDILRRQQPTRAIIGLSILTSGVLLSHYLCGLLLGMWYVLLGLQWLFLPADERRRLRISFGGLCSAALLGLLMAGPWLWQVWREAQRLLFVRMTMPTQDLDQRYFPNYLGYLWFLWGPARNRVITAIAGLSLLRGLLIEPGKSFAWWSAAVAVLSLPWGIQSVFRPDYFVIVAWLPTSLWCARIIHLGYQRPARWPSPRLAKRFALVAFMLLFLWGIYDTMNLINPETVLATESDLQALRWIALNTPGEARFFINTVPWQQGQYRGIDGGWWITPLTGRQTLLSPAIYGWGGADYASRIAQFAERAFRLSGCDQDLRQLMRDAHLTYAYLGSIPGTITHSILDTCPGFHPVFHQDSVTIYEIREP